MGLQLQDLTAKMSFRSVSVWRVIAIVSIVGHILLIWFSSVDIRENTPVFYWQKYSNYVIYLKLLTFVFSLITIWFSSEPKVRDWMIFLAIMGSCFIFGFANYVSLFASRFVNHVGTVELRGKIYQLVSVAKYDDETAYYFGACDQSGYICTFRHTYSLFLFGVQPVSKFELSDDGQRLALELNGETVFRFDGEEITCKDSDYGFCINNIP